MRIFYVETNCDMDEVLKQLSGDKNAEFRKCHSVKEALEYAKEPKEDKISVIFMGTKESSTEERCPVVLKVQTFGNFEVFYKDKPVAFGRAKAKELFAYLIDRRGATVTTAEACGILWEDKEYNFSLQRQFQTVVSDLIKSLKRHNLEHLLRRRRNCLSVEVSGLECDFYRLLEGDTGAKDLYNGEYMSNYSWAEMTAGFLVRRYECET